VLDEPTADLDAAAEARVLAAVREKAEGGAAVLLVAHRPELLAFADRVVHVAGAPARAGEPADASAPVTSLGFGAGL
jgi:ABC-type transport system involved in cytochrome bd biosynthesis fused ATPase/permease subunit